MMMIMMSQKKTPVVVVVVVVLQRVVSKKRNDIYTGYISRYTFVEKIVDTLVQVMKYAVMSGQKLLVGALIISSVVEGFTPLASITSAPKKSSVSSSDVMYRILYSL